MKYINKNKKKTKKHKLSIYKQTIHKKTIRTDNTQSQYIYKLLDKILLPYKNIHNYGKDGKDENPVIVLRPDRPKYNTKIINYIIGIEDILQINTLKNKFKTFFTLDYMNYVNLDIDKRKSEISNITLTYNNQPIIFEGYLAIVITSGIFYDSYMLDTLKIITSKDQENNLYFPQDLPDNFVKEYETPSRMISKIYEIINQAYTIIKYIAIILAHQLQINKLDGRDGRDGRDNKNKYPINSFEIIKVRILAYDDLSLVLDRCNIKKDWKNTKEDYKILNWLNSIFFTKIIKKSATLNLKKETSIKEVSALSRLSTLSLYKRDLSEKQKNIAIQSIYAHNMSRKDFNNKFVIISSDFIKKDSTKVDFNFKELIKYLKKYGLEFEEFYTTVGTKPAFIFYPYDAPANKHLITQHYNTTAYCANTLDSLENINNKSDLFFYLKKLYPNDYKDFIADSFLLKHSTKYIPGKIYIARPINELDPKTGKIKVNAFAGKDIIYITSQETLESAKRLLGKYDNVLISDYITNPLLFQGRKFHLRVYLIITYINSEVKTHFFRDNYIWTAGKPFVLDKFHDKDIHDTHYTSTDDDYLFSSDFTTENIGRKITEDMKTKLLDDMESIMNKIREVAVYGNTGVKLFTNHKNGFQMEGIDIMINDKMQPILIECNDKAGVSNRTDKGMELQKQLIAFINKCALEPVFGSKS